MVLTVFFYFYILRFMIGGRQVDGTIPALIALEKITAHPRIREAQHSGKFTVLFDSGIRRGADIIKAVAIGAQAVLCKSSFHSNHIPSQLPPFVSQPPSFDLLLRV